MKGERILVDTSVWIDYLQKGVSNLSQALDRLLSEKDIYVPKIVIAELIQGARTEKEISAIERFMEAFHIIDEGTDTWIKAGRLSYQLKRKGKTINLADCYIATIAQEHGCQILTLDEHFKEIKKVTNIAPYEY